MIEKAPKDGMIRLGADPYHHFVFALCLIETLVLYLVFARKAPLIDLLQRLNRAEHGLEQELKKDE